MQDAGPTIEVRGDTRATVIVDGREFSELRDIDDCHASVLEVLVGSRCLFLPYEHLKRLRLQPAEGLLDTIHRPAEVRTTTDDTIACRLPLTYPPSGRAGRAWVVGTETDRMQYDGGPVHGLGARLLLTDEEEFTLGDCRQLDFLRVE